MNNNSKQKKICNIDNDKYSRVCCQLFNPDTDLSKSVSLNIRDFLKSRDIFIIPEIFDDCIVLNEENTKYIINGTDIYIETYLNEGLLGIVFIAKDTNNKQYIIKFTPLINDELQIMESISQIMQEFKYPHFVYLFKQKLCKKIETSSVDTNSKFENYISKINDKFINSTTTKEYNIYTNENYSMYIMELFDDNIVNLLTYLQCSITDSKSKTKTKTALNIKIAASIYAQIYMATYMMHKCMGYYHNDVHYGNFFYKKITYSNKDYFHYVISGRDIYIKNMGYLIVIADYGYSKAINTKKININNLLADYIFTNYNIKHFKYINISSDLIEEFNLIENAIKKNNIPNDYSESDFFNYLINNQKDMFYTKSQLPKNIICINEEPYIIPDNYKSHKTNEYDEYCVIS
jgi:hypothetical protein